MSESRRYPEFALGVGILLGLPVAVFVGLFGDPLLAVLVGLVVSLPFAAYAVHVDDDPTTVLVPRYVLAGAGAGALLTALAGVVTGRPALGALVGLAVGVPAVAYHVRYAPSLNPLDPLVTGAVALVVAVAVAGTGLLTGDPVAGAVGGLLALLSGGDYLRERETGLARRTERLVVAGSLGAAVVVIVGSVLLSQALVGAILGAGLLAAGALVAS